MSFKQLNDLSTWAEVAGIVQAILTRFSVSKNASLYYAINAQKSNKADSFGKWNSSVFGFAVHHTPQLSQFQLQIFHVSFVLQHNRQVWHTSFKVIFRSEAFTTKAYALARPRVASPLSECKTIFVDSAL